MSEQEPIEVRLKRWEAQEAARLVEDARKRTSGDDAAGRELQKQDTEDPERGPIRRLLLSVSNAAPYSEGSLQEEFKSFQHAFNAAVTNHDRYRLYHYLIGSTPPGTADRFDFKDPIDAEEKWSIETKMRELADKYHIIDRGKV